VVGNPHTERLDIQHGIPVSYSVSAFLGAFRLQVVRAKLQLTLACRHGGPPRVARSSGRFLQWTVERSAVRRHVRVQQYAIRTSKVRLKKKK